MKVSKKDYNDLFGAYKKKCSEYDDILRQFYYFKALVHKRKELQMKSFDIMANEIDKTIEKFGKITRY